MRYSPTDAQACIIELCLTVRSKRQTVKHGALVRFTSKKQMEQVCNALPPAIQVDVLMRNMQTRRLLLSEHRNRVVSGQRSILFGMQSFGKGLDLPGQLCEVVVIAKLPFGPPNSPIEEAWAVWREKSRRSLFVRSSVLAMGNKMQQWAGRRIRTETDTARIVCMGNWLNTKAYGKQIMIGLPPFRRETGAAYPIY